LGILLYLFYTFSVYHQSLDEVGDLLHL
jgi:hypothetical protein